MNVLLSIKPEFAEKILDQEKRYEFRKTRFRDPSRIETIYLYASSPVQEIVGSFSLGEVIEGTPEQLWRDFGSVSGIDDRSRFMNYFGDTETGYAIEVGSTSRFTRSIDPHKYMNDFRPPVSFQYLRDEHDFLLTHTPPTSGSD
jgi:type I restriction enzyme S subunit